MNFDARSIGAIRNENIVAAHPIVIAGSSVADVRGISLNWFAYIDCSFHIVHIVHNLWRKETTTALASWRNSDH